MKSEFIITTHAEQRIQERFNCRKDKIMKVCQKAWQSQTPPNKLMVYFKKQRTNNKKSVYKVFQGLVFVFKYRHNKDLNYTYKVLITVYNPKLYESSERVA